MAAMASAIPPSTSSLLATYDRKARHIIHDLRASLSSLESMSSSSTSSSDPAVVSEHQQHLQTLRNGLTDLDAIGAEMDTLLSARTGRGREPENVLELWRRKRAGLNDEMESVRNALVNIERREVRTDKPLSLALSHRQRLAHTHTLSLRARACVCVCVHEWERGCTHRWIHLQNVNMLERERDFFLFVPLRYRALISLSLSSQTERQSKRQSKRVVRI